MEGSYHHHFSSWLQWQSLSRTKAARLKIFRGHWSQALLDDLESFEVQEFASLLCPEKALLHYVSAGRRVLLGLIKYGPDSVMGPIFPNNAETAVHLITEKNEDRPSNALGDFQDAEGALA